MDALDTWQVTEIVHQVRRKGLWRSEFWRYSKGKIFRKCSIGTNPRIDDVSLVKGLKFNLISVSKLCDKGIDVNFRR